MDSSEYDSNDQWYNTDNGQVNVLSFEGVGRPHGVAEDT